MPSVIGAPALPDVLTVRRVLGRLLGVEVSATSGPAQNLEDPFDIAVAGYANADGEPVAAGICDREFVAHAGGAYSIMAPVAVEEALRAERVPTATVESLHDLLAAAAPLFSEAGFGPVALSAVYWGPAAVPAALKALIAAPWGRSDLWVSIDGYGKGRMILMTGARATAAPPGANALANGSGSR